MALNLEVLTNTSLLNLLEKFSIILPIFQWISDFIFWAFCHRFIYIIGASLSEPHTSESLQNVHLTVSRNLVNHSVFGRTYVQQCHGIRYTSQDFVRSIVSRNSCSTVSRNLVNQSIFYFNLYSVH